MLQRDYMMRMIAGMTEALGQMMGLRRQQKHEEALSLSGDLLEKLLRIRPELARRLSAEDLIDMLGQRGTADPDDIRALGLLMGAEADTLEELGREAEANVLRGKALHMHLAAELEEQAHKHALSEELLASGGAERIIGEHAKQERADEAAPLLAKLAGVRLPARTGKLAADGYERRGRYDKAEDLWYAMLEDGDARVEEAAAFYERLEQRSDEQLIAGGLPRDEVLLGIAGLERMKE
ncbi:DUF6483 family protein [Paenibacillus sp. MMS18-CY102]|uniref:DUF6483 family protein n=1 Tax=Paenibacillus sp. MMS18-CY102 TaxID=2682849 RepID=UPI001365DDB9|nr:DUF6483 family protein [Paenibacillus sp. MMS18-CY102]MWC30065.1 hypothetical protein [Paenibacillus sp. MMS18-CY102]